jgi:uncharacterized protein
MRKLMGRFGTTEMEVDNLLRNEVFVDLYRVVQQGLRVGEVWSGMFGGRSLPTAA